MGNNTKYDVFNGLIWLKVSENYIKDIKRKQEIDWIFEHNDRIDVCYKDGSIACYQNIHGNYTFQYYA